MSIQAPEGTERRRAQAPRHGAQTPRATSLARAAAAWGNEHPDAVHRKGGRWFQNNLCSGMGIASGNHGGLPLRSAPRARDGDCEGGPGRFFGGKRQSLPTTRRPDRLTSVPAAVVPRSRARGLSHAPSKWCHPAAALPRGIHPGNV